VVFAPDGGRIFAASDDNTARLDQSFAKPSDASAISAPLKGADVGPVHAGLWTSASCDSPRAWRYFRRLRAKASRMSMDERRAR
jgi:hypothetical protein